MPVNSKIAQKYWNPVLGTYMRITSDGRIQIKMPSIAARGGKDRGKYVDLRDGDIADHSEYLSGWSATDPIMKDKRVLITQLQNLMDSSSLENVTKTVLASRKNFGERLSLLSPLELQYTFAKLRDLPVRDVAQYKRDIVKFVSNRTAATTNQYQNHFFRDRNGEIRKEYRFGRVLDGIRVSHARSLHVGGNEVIGQNANYKAMVKVKHPKAGVLLFARSDGDSGWVPFDGLATTDNGNLVIDESRSGLLQKHGLAPHLLEISELLNEAESEELLPWGEGKNDIHLKDAQSFNNTHSNGRHLPTSPIDDGKLELLDKVLSEDKWLMGRSFKKMMEDYERYGVGGLADAAGRVFLENPAAVHAIFNDLSNLDASKLSDLAFLIDRHHYIAAGHSELVGENHEDLYEVVNERNRRQEPDPSNAHPVTGYNRPLSLSGKPILYEGMTGDEKKEFRKHWDNLHGRAKGWLQHTDAGRQRFDGVIDQARKDFEDMGGFEGWRTAYWESHQRTNLFTGDITDDNKFRDAGGSKGMPKGYRVEDLTIAEILSRMDEEIIYEQLTGDQLDILDWINEDSKAKLAFGVTSKEDGLDAMFKQDAYDRLLGTPLKASYEDKKRMAKMGRSDSNEIIIGGQVFPKDEQYNLLQGGELSVSDNGKIDIHKGFILHDSGTGEDGESREDIDLALVHPEVGLFGKTGDSFAADLSSFLDQSVIDQFVRDGFFPQRYASVNAETGEVNAVRREDAPEPPEYGSPEMLQRAAYLYARVSQYPSNRNSLGFSGVSNEYGMLPYKLDKNDPLAILSKIQSDGGSFNMLDKIYEDFNKDNGLSVGDDGFLEFIDQDILDQIREDEAAAAEAAEAGEGDDLPPIAEEDEDDLLKAKEYISVADHYQKEAERLAKDHPYDDDMQRLSKDNLRKASHFREKGRAWTAYVGLQHLDSDPAFQQFKQEIRNKKASEVLQNAPVAVRATAFRQRIASIRDSLSAATTIGEAHDLMRDLIRVGVEEYPDMIQIDRDGTSQFRVVSRQLERVGVDLTVIDKELNDHRDTIKSLEGDLESWKENEAALLASGLVPDPKSVPMKEWTPEQTEKWDLLQAIRGEMYNLQDQVTNAPSYGSDRHVKDLKTNDATSMLYRNLDMAQIGAENQEWAGSYNRIKDAKNVVADSVQAGLNTFRESKTLGRSSISSMLQAFTSVIGEGTGFGADRIRQLDVTKPIDQHRSQGRGNWSDWLFLPLIGIKDQTVAQWRDRQAGLQGQVYTPEPSAATPEYAEALEGTGGKIQTDTPAYDPDIEAPQVNQKESPYTSPKETPAQGQTDDPQPAPATAPVTNIEQEIPDAPVQTPPKQQPKQQPSESPNPFGDDDL